MILTGDKINKEKIRGRITISNYKLTNLNPNSYNYRLGRYLIFLDNDGKQVEIDLKKRENGFILEKGCLYLGHTYEIIGSKKYSMSLIGRSSLGRLGLFVQISANLGHVNSVHSWTLELVPCMNIVVYYKMKIGQVSFWKNFGRKFVTNHKYNRHNKPTVSYGVEYDTNRKKNSEQCKKK